jgi:hypothetical protein
MTMDVNDARPAASLVENVPEGVSQPEEAEEARTVTFRSRGVEPQIALAAVGRADRIFREMDALTSEVHAALCQARARLLCILLGEVQAMLNESLARKDVWRFPTDGLECLEASKERIPPMRRR